MNSNHPQPSIDQLNQAVTDAAQAWHDARLHSQTERTMTAAYEEQQAHREWIKAVTALETAKAAAAITRGF